MSDWSRSRPRSGRAGHRPLEGGPSLLRRHRRWGAALALGVAAVTVASAGCPAGAQPPVARASVTIARLSLTAVSLPNTPAGTQARWFLGAVTHWPIPTADVKAHFDRAVLAVITPAQLNAGLKGVTSVQVDSITTAAPDALVFVVTVNGTTKLSVSLSVDPQGLISGLHLAPVGAPSPPPAPSTWAGVDRMVRSVAPQVRFLVASVHAGTCQPLQAIDATTPAPLGSAFKLYVLDALAGAVASGKLSWAQKLTVTSKVKSLPSGTLQDDPDGTRLSVQQVAADMISISDNTAEDMVAGVVGRAAVEEATRASGMADPALDVPFLTTRELFVLKLDDWPKLAQHYLALGPAGRQALLAGTVDHEPLSPDLSPWTTPRDVGSLEWFASPTDICHVYASLAAFARRPGLAPVASILELNPGGMDLGPSRWRSVWFKGGSEPGVLTLNYLATTTSGRSYVVSVLAEDPTAPISQTSATLTLLSAVKGAFELAAR